MGWESCASFKHCDDDNDVIYEGGRETDGKELELVGVSLFFLSSLTQNLSLR